MPGVGIKTAAQLLLAIGDGSDFDSAGLSYIRRYCAGNQTIWLVDPR